MLSEEAILFQDSLIKLLKLSCETPVVLTKKTRTNTNKILSVADLKELLNNQPFFKVELRNERFPGRIQFQKLFNHFNLIYQSLHLSNEQNEELKKNIKTSLESYLKKYEQRVRQTVKAEEETRIPKPNRFKKK